MSIPAPGSLSRHPDLLAPSPAPAGSADSRKHPGCRCHDRQSRRQPPSTRCWPQDCTAPQTLGTRLRCGSCSHCRHGLHPTARSTTPRKFRRCPAELPAAPQRSQGSPATAPASVSHSEQREQRSPALHLPAQLRCRRVLEFTHSHRKVPSCLLPPPNLGPNDAR